MCVHTYLFQLSSVDSSGGGTYCECEYRSVLEWPIFDPFACCWSLVRWHSSNTKCFNSCWDEGFFSTVGCLSFSLLLYFLPLTLSASPILHMPASQSLYFFPHSVKLYQHFAVDSLPLTLNFSFHFRCHICQTQVVCEKRAVKTSKHDHFYKHELA